MKEPIAIIGRACVLPGANDIATLSHNFRAGRDLVTAAPKGRWRLDDRWALGDSGRDCAWSSHGGYVTGFEDVFDPAAYALPADVVADLDPVFTWSMHVTRQALLDAGVEPSAAVALVLGNLSFPSEGMTELGERFWLERNAAALGVDLDALNVRRRHLWNRFSSGLPAHVVAAGLGLGEAYALDAACATSLYAVRLAADKLANREADVVVAAAVNRADSLFLHVGFCALNALSPTGQSRPFHVGADGLIPAEGAASVVLKRLSDAERDGDHIYGIVRGVGLSNDGRGRGFLAPSQQGQERAIRNAYRNSGVDPAEVDYIECHATGTSLGDATELGSMQRIWGEGLKIGSHKSNFGHAITVAGMSGLLKLLDAIERSELTPTIHTEDPIALALEPFDLITSARPWSGRFAGVNAFGFGGNNAHLLVERPGYEPGPIAPTPAPSPEPIAIVATWMRVGDLEGSDQVVDAYLRGAAVDPKMSAIDVELGGLRFPPRDLDQTLGQQLVMLEAARRVATDEVLTGADRDRISVLVGIGVDAEIVRYGGRWRMAQWGDHLGFGPDWVEQARDAFTEPLAAEGVVGSMPNIPANRVNSQLDVRGPSFTVSSEELSGVRALEIAKSWLTTGEIDAAIVGASELACEPLHESVCEALGSEQRPSDAVVVLVLRRLADARAANLNVIAVLDESAAAATPFDTTRARAIFGAPHAAVGLLDVALAAHVAATGVSPTRTGTTRSREPQRSVTVETSAFGMQSRAITVASVGAPHAVPVAETLGVWFAHGDSEQQLTENVRSNNFVARPTAAHRVAIVASASTLPHRVDEALAVLATNRTNDRGIFVHREGDLGGELAFVFGDANGYPASSDDLLQKIPSLAAELYASPSPSLEHHSVEGRVLHAAAVARAHRNLSVALNLQPTAEIGYGFGEVAARLVPLQGGDGSEAAILERRLFSEELAGNFGAVRAAWAADGHIVAATSQPEIWESWSVVGDLDLVRRTVETHPLCHITAINTDDECVISGAPADIEAVLLTLLQDPKTLATRWSHSTALHAPESAHVAPLLQELFADEALVAALTQPIDFPAQVREAYANGTRVFVEHGPHGHCTGWIGRILGDQPHVAVAFDRDGVAAEEHVLGVLAQLILVGVDVDWRDFTKLLTERRERPMGKSLTFAAHAAPVILRRGDAIVMPPPPARPFEGAPLVQVAQPAAHVAQPVATPPVMPAAQPQPAIAAPTLPGYVPQTPLFGGPVGHILDFQREVANVHAAFMAQQSVVHHQFLALQHASVAQLASAYQRGRHQVLAPQPPAVVAPIQQPAPQVPQVPQPVQHVAPEPAPVAPVAPAAPAHTPRSNLTLSREDLEFLAHGPISKIFGPQFAEQDQYDVVVRMPMPPLLLADRIPEIDAEPATMKAGRIVSETDVREDSWWLYNGRMPAGIMIESGQADLLLVSYVGVDLLNRGERVYRLLGCKLTYRGDLPTVGETLRYDIEIDGFAKHGDVRLFFFHYDCTVGGDVRLQVRHGQAGFFTYDELEESGGILWRAETGEFNADARIDEPLLRTERTHLTKDHLLAFSRGEVSEVFGPAWDLTQTHLRTPCISGGRMMFLDRVTDLEYRGGPWQRGYLRAEADITPDHWFFEGHFFNDPCMPGTLMFEAALQAMTVYFVAQGVTLQRDAWRFQPMKDVEFDMRCRGQVDPESKLTVYEIFVESFDDGSRDGIPKLVADMLVTVDGLGAFHCRGMALELVPDYPQPKLAQPLTPGSTPLANEQQVRAIQLGRPSDAFGAMYADFDGVRNVPRLPNPPYDLVTRVASATGHMSMATGAEIVAEYDVDPNAWYFAEGDGEMPYGVLLEAALQPCGWLASWVGCAATSTEDVFFRNLDGTGTLHRSVRPSDRMLTTTAKLVKLSRSGAMTIVGFEVQTSSGDEPIYTMNTVFGFFPAEALASQAGITDAAPPPLPTTGVQRHIGGVGMLGLLTDVIEQSEDGGIHGAGRVVARMAIDPGAWFFKAHFFSDPVQPGSLGLQLMLDALSLFDVRKPAAAIAAGGAHTWKYRGQVRPWKKEVTVDVHRRVAEDGTTLADGWLWTDGECIFRFEGFSC